MMYLVNGLKKNVAEKKMRTHGIQLVEVRHNWQDSKRRVRVNSICYEEKFGTITENVVFLHTHKPTEG